MSRMVNSACFLDIILYFLLYYITFQRKNNLIPKKKWKKKTKIYVKFR